MLGTDKTLQDCGLVSDTTLVVEEEISPSGGGEGVDSGSSARQSSEDHGLCQVAVFDYLCNVSWDRTKTRNGLENGSKNGWKICSPSGRVKSFHGRSLTSVLVTRTSMQVSPPTPSCAASKALQVNKIRYAASWSGSQEKMTVTQGDRTKTRNGLENGSKKGSIKVKICSPSGRGKNFHGRSLTSVLVTRTSMQVSPPAPPCAASKVLQQK